MKRTDAPRLAKKARLRFDRHSGGHLLVYPERGLALNESATAIVKLCDGTRTVEQIVEELSREAGATAAERPGLEQDVLELLDDLARRRLLE